MCFSQGSDFELKTDIIDPSTISLTYDRDGLVTLSLVITSAEQKGLGCYSLALADGMFRGIIESVGPTRLAGTNLIENSIMARGVVTAGGSGGGTNASI